MLNQSQKYITLLVKQLIRFRKSRWGRFGFVRVTKELQRGSCRCIGHIYPSKQYTDKTVSIGD